MMLWTYLVYVAVSVAVTIWVGRACTATAGSSWWRISTAAKSWPTR